MTMPDYPPIPTFTRDHLAPLQAHIDDAGNPHRLTHSGAMTSAERDCVTLGLLDVDGPWRTVITPAGTALLQAVALPA